jgi:hypothetical protein
VQLFNKGGRNFCRQLCLSIPIMQQLLDKIIYLSSTNLVHGLLVMLIVTPMVKISPVLMESEASIPHSLKYAIPHYPKSNNPLHTYNPLSLRLASVFSVITLCRLEKVHCFFQRTHHLHLLGHTESQSRNLLKQAAS